MFPNDVIYIPQTPPQTTSAGNEHTLTIVCVDMSDQGEIVCHAHNPRGSTSYTCVLHVRSLRGMDSGHSGGRLIQKG